MNNLTVSAVEDLVSQALIRCGTSDANARSVARALVRAEAIGLKGHGLSRVASYAAQAKNGKIDGHAKPAVTRPKPAILAIDAAHGFAYPALDIVRGALPDIVRAQGVGVAAVRRSHHCGAAGLPVEDLAQAGLVSLLFANTPAAMAPWGGRTAVFGTNPIAFACPRAGGPPMVVDLSLSKVARGNIMAAKQRGVPIPEGWALNAEGRPTTDANAALAGTMVPLGDAKGTALALMVEILAAGLTGSNYAADASSFLDDKGGPPGTGQLIIALDPQAIGGDAALDRFEALTFAISEQSGARVPGGKRAALWQQALEAGLAVDTQVVDTIAAL